MIFLNIWLGGVLPKTRQRCVNSFVKMMKAEDIYFLINDTNIDGIYLNAIKTHSNWWRVYSERGVQFKTDFIRFYLACRVPDLFYADTDVLFGRQFRFPDAPYRKPVLGQWMNLSETFLFYVNSRCDYFRFLMKTAEKFNPENVFFPSHLFTLPKVQKNIIKFEETTFSHQRLGVY
jgi:hypothetical protein